MTPHGVYMKEGRMTQLHPDVLLLAELERAEWPAIRERIRLSGHPTCEDDDEDDADKTDDPADDVKDDDAKDEDKNDDDDDHKPAETNWKQQARRHEREAKAARDREAKARKREADLTAKLKEREDADKTEQEKAVEKARTDATTDVTSKYEQERRAERLELAVTRAAISRGVKVGEGDKQKTVKFTDAEDVQMWVERQIRNGAADDIYTDEGKVNASTLIDLLADLAASKPSWLQGATNGAGKVADFDAGKGKGGPKGIEDMSVEEHYKRMSKP